MNKRLLANQRKLEVHAYSYFLPFFLRIPKDIGKTVVSLSTFVSGVQVQNSLKMIPMIHPTLKRQWDLIYL